MARHARPLDSLASRIAFQPLEPRRLLFGDPVFDLGTLDGQNGFRIPGIAASGQLGFAVTALGDVNGDQIDDLAISAPSAGGSFQDGLAYVVFGATGLGTGGQLDLDTLDGSNGFVISGIEVGSHAGWSISFAGDVNNDDYGDFVIGAPFANKAYLVYGSATLGSGGSFSLGEINGINGVEILGGPDDAIGLSVSGIGDLNSDGYDDIALGSAININNSGVAYVVFGGSSLGATGPINVLNLDGITGLTIWGTNSGDELGWTVSEGGDLNNDGIADLAVGAIESESNGPGSAYVIFGAVGIGLDTQGRIDVTGLDGTGGFVIRGETAGGLLSFSLSGGDDVNGDGVDDLIVGSITQQAFVIFGAQGIGAGGQFDLAGLDGANGYIISTPIAAGAHAVHAGDLNNDGVGDVAVAAFGRDEVYVYVGGASVGSNGTFDITTVDGENGFVIQGVALIGGLIGSPVSRGRDVNNDGFADLLVGAAAANQSAGEAYVLLGIDIGDLSAPANLVATPLNPTSIELQWEDTTLFEDGFEIERSYDGATGWLQVGLAQASDGTGGVVVHQDDGLSPNTEYFYRVRAYNQTGRSAYSSSAHTVTPGVPTAPSNLQVATLSDSALRLTWNDNSSDESGFTIYRLSGETFVLIGTAEAGATLYDDSELGSATTYYYLVRAYNAQGESDDSNIASGTTDGGSISVPTAPSDLLAMAISQSQIQLDWVDHSDNEDGFIVERALDPTLTWTTIDTVAADVTQYVDMGLPADSTYFYRVRAVNTAGTSTPTNVAGATTSPIQGGGRSEQFVDDDGDVVTFSLVGVGGTITFTTNGESGIDTVYVGATQTGAGSLIVSITPSLNGDGRVQIGQLQGDISLGDLYVRLATVNLGLVDIVGDGVWLCDVNRAVLGDITGSASIHGRVADLTVRDVDSTGNFSLCDVFSFKARSVDLSGGFDAHSIANFVVDGSASLRLTLDGDRGLGSMRIGGDAMLQLDALRAGQINILGNARFTGASQIDDALTRLKIGGSWLSGSLTVGRLLGKIEIVGDAAASATLNSSGGCLVVCGDSSATFNLDHFLRFTVKGDLVGGSVNITNSNAATITIKGDFAGGAIETDGAGLWCLRIDGSFVEGAAFDSDGDLHKAMIRGSLDGAMGVISAYSITVCVDFTGAFAAGGTDGEVVHLFSVKGAADGGRFAAVGDVNCIVFGKIDQAEVYVGLPTNWNGGLPYSLGDFVQQSVLRKLQVRGETNGATIAAASIADLCLREISDQNTFHLAAGRIDRAKMIVENQFYHLGLNKIFSDLPMLEYLDIVQLLESGGG